MKFRLASECSKSRQVERNCLCERKKGKKGAAEASEVQSHGPWSKEEVLLHFSGFFVCFYSTTVRMLYVYSCNTKNIEKRSRTRVEKMSLDSSFSPHTHRGEKLEHSHTHFVV